METGAGAGREGWDGEKVNRQAHRGTGQRDRGQGKGLSPCPVYLPLPHPPSSIPVCGDWCFDKNTSQNTHKYMQLIQTQKNTL